MRNKEKNFARPARIFGNWMCQIAMLITALKFGLRLVRKILAFLKRKGHHLATIFFFCHAMKKKNLRAACAYLVTGFKLQFLAQL